MAITSGLLSLLPAVTTFPCSLPFISASRLSTRRSPFCRCSPWQPKHEPSRMGRMSFAYVSPVFLDGAGSLDRSGSAAASIAAVAVRPSVVRRTGLIMVDHGVVTTGVVVRVMCISGAHTWSLPDFSSARKVGACHRMCRRTLMRERWLKSARISSTRAPVANGYRGPPAPGGGCPGNPNLLTVSPLLRPSS